MVLSQADLAASLQNEVRILLHLCSKLEPASAAEYRPTPKQRTSLELLRYLTVMGPELVPAIRDGKFSREAFQAASAEAAKLDLAAVVTKLATLSDYYGKAIPEFTDAELAGEVDLFGSGGMSRGRWLVDFCLCGHAAYRTQLFMNLKACGREELGTMNLWAGMDPAPAAA
jgi:hypothetical protein